MPPTPLISCNTLTSIQGCGAVAFWGGSGSGAGQNFHGSGSYFTVGVDLILHGTFLVQEAEFFPVLKTVLSVHKTIFMI